MNNTLMTFTEMLRLEKVETTPDQANTIYKRNKGLLMQLWAFEKKIRDPESGKIIDLYEAEEKIPELQICHTFIRGNNIGCPHCLLRDKYGRQQPCKGCVWGNNGECGQATFFGISLIDNIDRSRPTGHFVVYKPDSEFLSFRTLIAYDDMHIRWDRIIENSEKFLLGHMQWAEYVLNGKWSWETFIETRKRLKKEWEIE